MAHETTHDRTILIFHGIGTPSRPLEAGEPMYWLTHKRFCEILDMVKEMGVAGPEITFDDGNASDIELALPELEMRGLHATFFLLTGRLGLEGSLTETDVKVLADSGQNIGLHGHSHRDWRNLDKSTRTEEYRTARQKLSDLSGQEIESAAAPFGLYDRRVISDLMKEGFRALHTSDWGRAATGNFIQPRNCIDNLMGTDDIVRTLNGGVVLTRKPRRLLGLAKKRLLPLRVKS